MSSDPELDKLERQVEKTQASLHDKIEKLEDHVTGAVEETVGAVRDTVDSVTEKVEHVTDTVSEQVSGALDFAGHFARHPWPILGATALVGYIAGRMIFESPIGSSPSERMGRSFHRSAAPMTEAPSPAPPPSSAPSQGMGLPPQLTEFLDESATMLKGAALAAGSALLTEVIQNLFGDKVSHTVENRLTPYFKEEKRT